MGSGSALGLGEGAFVTRTADEYLAAGSSVAIVRAAGGAGGAGPRGVNPPSQSTRRPKVARPWASASREELARAFSGQLADFVAWALPLAVAHGSSTATSTSVASAFAANPASQPPVPPAQGVWDVSKSTATLRFSPQLSSFDRMLVHVCADAAGLKHGSLDEVGEDGVAQRRVAATTTRGKLLASSAAGKEGVGREASRGEGFTPSHLILTPTTDPARWSALLADVAGLEDTSDDGSDSDSDEDDAHAPTHPQTTPTTAAATPDVGSSAVSSAPTAVAAVAVAASEASRSSAPAVAPPRPLTEMPIASTLAASGVAPASAPAPADGKLFDASALPPKTDVVARGNALMAQLHAKRLQREAEAKAAAAASSSVSASGAGDGRGKRGTADGKGGKTAAPADDWGTASAGGEKGGAGGGGRIKEGSAAGGAGAFAPSGGVVGRKGGGGGGGSSGVKVKPAVLAGPDADDEDALLDALLAESRHCAWAGPGGCRKPVTTMGANCGHCKLRYCLTHSLPEDHGCGADAAAAARAERGAPAPPFLRGWKRDAVARELEKRIDAAVEARSAAPPPGGSKGKGGGGAGGGKGKKK